MYSLVLAALLPVADPAPNPLKTPPVTIEDRVQALEGRVTSLETKISGLGAVAKGSCPCGGACACPAGKCPDCPKPSTFSHADSAFDYHWHNGILWRVPNGVTPDWSLAVMPRAGTLPVFGGCAGGSCGVQTMFGGSCAPGNCSGGVCYPAR